MKVSIAMATYNGERFLREQLASFVQQTQKPDELVVCDDGSSDGTMTLLTDFARQAPFRVVLVRNKRRLGYTKNFEKAISMCHGTLIFLSDQDDVWFEEKIQTMKELFRQRPDALLMIHDGLLADARLHSRGASKRAQAILLTGNDDGFATGTLSVIHRRAIPLVFPIPDGIIGHDVWIHQVMRRLRTRAVVDRPLQYLRRHGRNTSNWAANKVEGMGRLDAVVIQISGPAAVDYGYLSFFNRMLQTHLTTVGERFPELVSTRHLEEVLCWLQGEQHALMLRQALLAEGPVRRRWTASRMLWAGHYRYFRGWQSFLRDLLR